jgi:IS5 family transposase
MKPKDRNGEGNQAELFRARLDNIIDPAHPLYKLASGINWSVFEKEFGELYVENFGRPGLPTRLMVGLHYLKHTYDVSDERVVETFLENPYWQYFCGYQYFQHRFPCDPSSLTRWRKRVGAEGIEKLLKETIETAKRERELKPSDIERVNVDTTVQEKAIAFPTDARLYHKMRAVLVREAKKAGIEMRQTYERVSKRALRKQGSYAHAQQSKRASKEIKRLKTFLGRVVRDLLRKCQNPSEKLLDLLFIAERVLTQEKHEGHKVYSIHAPEVECISKGKAHKKYEFGCKVSVVTTSRKGWIVGIDALTGNPYDGHSLKAAINQVEKLTNQKPKQAFVDKGYRGKEHHPEGVAVYISGRRGLSRRLLGWLQRRSAIEPVIGHAKADHRLDRNFLLGRVGDRINAMLSGCGFNLRKLLRAFFFFFFNFAFWVRWVKKKAEQHYFAGSTPFQIIQL